ncbi:TVP38/TMEM64 family protein [Guptibacillus hwajinpoensis]|uniref:TVP38/TMEM64 family membrane protein n=1 Tax=Guptibacillus hwajinpoensis TaxID=208199 RepID=A0ABU0K508_9BACL|nr:TVP38/TMEM64 family protein [Alkalihalobacillus hemicentroti]MDQ0484438.1 putative membrane protein YdjX (TVP38/TMEM64 family) [Alkalihalobacillus hemicentroti]
MKKNVSPLKWTGLALLIMIPIIFFINPQWFTAIRSFLSLDSLSLLADYFRSLGIWAPFISIALMIAQGIIAPLPSFVITAANGLAFGIPLGIIISWTGGMAAALVMFLLARILGASFVEKITKKSDLLAKANRYSGENGFFLIFVARIIPIVSFDIISLIAGLSNIKFRSFVIATGLGQIPGTVLYTIVGHDIANLDQYQDRFIWTSIVLVAFLIIGKLRSSHKANQTKANS